MQKSGFVACAVHLAGSPIIEILGESRVPQPENLGAKPFVSALRPVLIFTPLHEQIPSAQKSRGPLT